MSVMSVSTGDNILETAGGNKLSQAIKEKKLLDAYRFVFSRHFLNNDRLISALETWQPDIYNLILSDINSGS